MELEQANKKEKTLLIMAAGMGSRFGGLKQIEPIGPNKEFIIDYSIYDAKRAGFTKVISIIKKENYQLFKDSIGERIEPYIKTEYIFQDNTWIPNEYLQDIEKRKKPLGTAYAIMCAKHKINEPFAVINADDFYGYDAYQKASQYLDNIKENCYAMIGYRIENTLSPNGVAKRGICELKGKFLKEIIESSVERKKGKIISIEQDTKKQNELSENTIVSMNLLLFTEDIFDILTDRFSIFLDNNKKDLSEVEFQIPSILDYCIKENKKQIQVIETTARWQGITYKKDKENVVIELERMIQNKEYPQNLWKN